MKKSGKKELAWQERIGQVGIDRSEKVGMDVKVLPEVREQFNALAIARGISPQRYLERLIVDEINNNVDLVKQGQGYLDRTKGNFRKAAALFQDDTLTKASRGH